MSIADDRQLQIAEFLRTRRGRLKPAELGMPTGSRRRTPGLRREEVALLARVSTEWYARLEQVRNARASEDALRRIARALRLTPAEHAHLLRLSGYDTAAAESRSPAERDRMTPEIQAFLELQMPRPAYVLGLRWDLLAWNRAASALWGGIENLHGLERNSMYQLFLGDYYPSILMDVEMHRRRCVAMLRARGAEALSDPWFSELVEVLMERSPRFASLWNGQEIMDYRDGRKVYRVPALGDLAFDFLAMNPGDPDRAGLRIVVFIPVPETGTEERLAALLGK